MCRSGYVLVAGLVLLPHAAPCQSIAVLEARLDSLRSAEHSSHAALDAYRRLHKIGTDTTQDSVQVADGRITVVFTRVDSAFVREIGALLSEQVAGLGPFAARIAPLRYSIDSTARKPPLGGASDLKVVRYYLPGGGVSQTVAPRDPREIASVIMSRASEALVGSAPSPVRTWHPGPLPLDPSAQAHQNWALARMDVTMSMSPSGRRCYQGELADCRRFVGVDSVADPITQMFDADGRHGLVEARAELAERLNHALATQCRAQGIDSACVALLRMNDTIAIAALTNEYSRRSLLTYALNVGGQGAAGRLLGATGSIGDALAATANKPLDELMRGWQANLREGSLGFGGLSWPIVISSLAWMAVLAFVSFRSGRWR